MKIAVSTFKKDLAPSFDYGSTCSLFTVSEGRITDQRALCFAAGGAFVRVRTLLSHSVEVVMCNAIRNHTERILRSHRIEVVSGIQGRTTAAVHRFLKGGMPRSEIELNQVGLQKKREAGNILEWSRSFFCGHGFKLLTHESAALPFPIDFLGLKICPICRKPIRVAICCGTHLYRMDRELLELVMKARDRYDATFYVHPAFPGIARLCRQYRVKLLDATLATEKGQPALRRQPIVSHKSLTPAQGASIRLRRPAALRSKAARGGDAKSRGLRAPIPEGEVNG